MKTYVRNEEYLNHFSKDLSEDIKKYATEDALKFSKYIFTHKEKKQQYGYCTHCKEEFKTEGLKHNSKIECPNCKSECVIKSDGRGRKSLYDEAYFVYYEKSLKNPNVIVARGMHVTRDYTGEYHNVKTKCSVMYWYVFEMGKPIMLKKTSYWERSQTDENFKISKVYSCFNHTEFSRMITCYSRDSIRSAVKDTPFKYSTWENYDYKDMTEFFDLYSRYPCIEYLTKEGCKELVESKLNGALTYRSVNWKGKNIFKILKVDKQDLKEIKAKRINITFFFLKVFHDAKNHKWNLKTEEIITIAEEYLYDYDSLLNVSEYSSMRKLLNYFSKQYNDYNRDKKGIHYYDKGSVLRTFRDYINDCLLLGMDTLKDQVIFPKNLYVAHQNTIKQIKVKKNEKLDVLIKNRVKSLEKYIFKYNELIIRPAISSQELIDEGSALTHCVGTYANRYANGETNIFFIRKVSEPNKPYYTIEIKKDKIIQVHGKNNRSPSEDVTEFVKVFTEEKLNKKNKKNKIKISIPA